MPLSFDVAGSELYFGLHHIVLLRSRGPRRDYALTYQLPVKSSYHGTQVDAEVEGLTYTLSPTQSPTARMCVPILA